MRPEDLEVAGEVAGGGAERPLTEPVEVVAHLYEVQINVLVDDVRPVARYPACRMRVEVEVMDTIGLDGWFELIVEVGACKEVVGRRKVVESYLPLDKRVSQAISKSVRQVGSPGSTGPR